MGLWRDHLLPRLVDKGMDNDDVAALRVRALAGLEGEVVEIGFGSGLNVPFYPADVTRVQAVDPAVLGRKLAADRLAASDVPVEFVGLDGQRLPLADSSVDGAVCTFTLCTVDDAPAALAELRRVLRPGGALHFVEHGLAPDLAVVKWQRRLGGLHRLVFGGCQVARPIDVLLRDAGFTFERHDTLWMANAPRYVAFTHLGVARS